MQEKGEFVNVTDQSIEFNINHDKEEGGRE